MHSSTQDLKRSMASKLLREQAKKFMTNLTKKTPAPTSTTTMPKSSLARKEEKNKHDPSPKNNNKTRTPSPNRENKDGGVDLNFKKKNKQLQEEFLQTTITKSSAVRLKCIQFASWQKRPELNMEQRCILGLLENLHSILVGQEHIYDFFFKWLVLNMYKYRWLKIQSVRGTIHWDTSGLDDMGRNIAYITGPNGCGKTFFLENLRYPKLKFVSGFEYGHVKDVFLFIEQHHQKKLTKRWMQKKSIGNNNSSIVYPTIYVVEDIDILLDVSTRADELESYLPDSNPMIIITASYFKKYKALRLLKHYHHLSFHPIVEYPPFIKLNPYLEQNNGDVRNAKLQYWIDNILPADKRHVPSLSNFARMNIFMRIESLTNVLPFLLSQSSASMEDIIDEDRPLVFQYFMNVYKQDPTVVSSYVFGGKSLYLKLRKMVHEYGKVIAARKRKIEYDSEHAELVFLIKERRDDRCEMFTRRQGWNQYYHFIHEDKEDGECTRIRKYMTDLFPFSAKKI